MTTSPLVIPPLVQTFMEQVALKHAPDAKIKKKSESKLLRAIGWVVKPFNPHFQTDYITTLGSTIWVPDDFFETSSEMESLEIIAHETQHLVDLQRFGILLWVLVYGFPQILTALSVFALLGFWNKWFLFSLCFLLCLAPLPAPGRFMAEVNGYRSSILFGRIVYKHADDQMEELYGWIEEQLAGKWYYFTWPFREKIRKVLKDESFMHEPRFQELVKFLEENASIIIERS